MSAVLSIISWRIVAAFFASAATLLQLKVSTGFSVGKHVFEAVSIQLTGIRFFSVVILGLPFSTVNAQNAWSNYRSVQTKPFYATEQSTRQSFAQPYGQQSQRGYHWKQHAQPYDAHAHAQQGGVQIIVNQSFPTQTQRYTSRRAFINGQYLPELYRDPQYQIHDWSAQRLPQPLYGRYWVLVDGYYLLIKSDNFQIEFVQSL